MPTGGQPNPTLQLALGMHYLHRFLSGETIKGIAKDTKRHIRTVNKYMTKAANHLIESGQKEAHEKLVKQAIALYSAKMRYQLSKIEKGDDNVSLEIAERILKGLFILDHLPEEKQEVEAAHNEVIQFQMVKPQSQLPPITITSTPISTNDPT